MAAGETQTQMNPRSAQRQTLLAALWRAYPHRTNLREMRIGNSRYHVGSYGGPATEPASPRQAALGVASELTGGMGTIMGRVDWVHGLKHSSRPGSLACQVVHPGNPRRAGKRRRRDPPAVVVPCVPELHLWTLVLAGQFPGAYLTLEGHAVAPLKGQTQPYKAP